MIDWVSSTFHEYASFYARYAQAQWSQMSPLRYGFLLIGIGIFGWMLMKSSTKKC